MSDTRGDSQVPGVRGETGLAWCDEEVAGCGHGLDEMGGRDDGGVVGGGLPCPWEKAGS